MAAPQKILLKAEANKLGIPGYRTMSEAQLRTAIATAKGGASKGKGKAAPATSANGVKGKGKAAPAKGKTTSPAVKGKGKSAPAKKSTAKKSTPVKGKASQGTAKRPTTAKPSTKGKATAPKKGTQTAKPKSTRRKPGQPVGRATIDRTSIDWKVESNVGRTGKRHEVMVALRKHKGNYDKVFDALKGNAVKWYPTALNSYPNESNNKRHAAERALRWLINRVALDFVKATEQHVSGTRAGYGESKKPQDIRRRELREERAAARAKAERAAKRAAPAKKAPAGRGKAPAAKKPATRAGGTKGKGATAKGKGKGKR